ncbi:MAG TPA: DUF58 domain-containing protein [Bacteriovoracaceae bacterium]|nr:DUF58 domain-containing protein [Bacteriovoracaceae bacterium]
MKLREIVLKQFKKKVRVYILPTRMGGYLSGLIFLMFLLSVGYSNNLLLIFSLFLFGFNLIWVIQTHYHLQALRPSQVTTRNGHAGEPLSVHVRWKSSPRAPVNWTICMEKGNLSLPFHTYNETETESLGSVTVPHRGLWRWEHLKVASHMPFGLYQVWIYFPLDAVTYVYPPLSRVKFPVQETHWETEGETPVAKTGHGDISHLNSYQGADSARISWKHYARSGNLIVKEGEALQATQVTFRLTIPDSGAKEEYLSQLATQMVECYQRQVPFTFQTSGSIYGPDTSERHLHDCLKLICLC